MCVTMLCHLVKATEVTAEPVESNGSLSPGVCIPRSATGPTLGNEYGKTSLFLNMPVLCNETFVVFFSQISFQMNPIISVKPNLRRQRQIFPKSKGRCRAKNAFSFVHF